MYAPGVRLRARPSVHASAAPGRSPRWAWTTRTRSTSAPGCCPSTSTSSPGKRGTTTDLSFQMLGGEYTDDNVPDSQAAFDDRELDIAADGSFEWRVTPEQPVAAAGPRGLQRLVGTARLHSASPAHRHRGHRAAAADPAADREALRRSGKAAGAAGEDVAAVPAVVLQHLPVNTMVAPRLTPGGLATQYSSVGHFDLTPDQALSSRCPSPTRRTSASSSAASGTSRWTTSTTRRR